MKIRRIFGPALSLALLTSVVGATGTAFADPTEPTNASCMGIEAAAISPPGSSTEVPPGMPGLVQFAASELGGVDVFATLAAGLHEMSHDGCDSALE